MYFNENNMVLAIDPGSTTHGVLLWNTFAKVPVYMNPAATNREVYELSGLFNAVVIEDVDAVHGNIGNSTVDAIRNIGRFENHFKAKGYMVHLIGRSEIKRKFKCKDDAGIRAFLKEQYGNNVIKQIKSHCISALAVIHYYEQL